MLFSEVYGNYFNCVARILNLALDHPVDAKEIQKIVSEEAFGESMLTIPEAFSSGSWPLLDSDGRALVGNVPTMPLTILQKRWLKGILTDPRINLFNIDIDSSYKSLSDVELLFDSKTFVYYDKYLDGDPYESETYVTNWRTIHEAILKKRKISITHMLRSGKPGTDIVSPYRLEYSTKDDKFRLLASNISKTRSGKDVTINMAKIISVDILDEEIDGSYEPKEYRKSRVTLILTDERGALHRALLHFSHFEKVTERIDDEHYKLDIKYDTNDETELVIRVLSFGALLEVVSPNRFKGLVKTRLVKQMKLMKDNEN